MFFSSTKLRVFPLVLLHFSRAGISIAIGVPPIMRVNYHVDLVVQVVRIIASVVVRVTVVTLPVRNMRARVVAVIRATVRHRCAAVQRS